ncbi:MAG: type IV toxin-antitoxin system AbiEi family antitoxin domain-containing protein, partial [Acidimicrobiales bacterium]
SDSAVADRLRPLGPIFRAGDAVRTGLSWRDLYRARDSGLVVELSRGLYQLREMAGIDQIDFLVVCARSPQGMVCLGSALAYWDLSDQNLDRVNLAVPSGSHRPQIDHPPTQVHVFAAATFELGRIEVAVRENISFSISDPERTVVDCFRLRHRVGVELAVDGLRRYLRRPRSRAGRVLELAEQLRVRTPILETMRLLQE